VASATTAAPIAPPNRLPTRTNTPRASTVPPAVCSGCIIEMRAPQANTTPIRSASSSRRRMSKPDRTAL